MGARSYQPEACLRFNSGRLFLTIGIEHLYNLADLIKQSPGVYELNAPDVLQHIQAVQLREPRSKKFSGGPLDHLVILSHLVRPYLRGPKSVAYGWQLSVFPLA
jgi:hypothetical protein